jgi:RNA polymerase sigma-70 factor (ECF subfamily)
MPINARWGLASEGFSIYLGAPMDYKDASSRDLIQHCVTSKDSAAWLEFIRRFQPLIAGVVARTARRWTILSTSLRKFQNRYKDAIYGFLKIVAYNATMDYFKAQNTSKRGAALATGFDPDIVFLTHGQTSTTEDQVVQREIDHMIDRIAIDRRDKTVFLLYYRQGFTAKAIAQIPRIELTAKGVESCLHRLTAQLREQLTRTEK